MFRGSLPSSLQRIIAEHAAQWDVRDIYVGCSGAFTIERVLAHVAGGRFALHGNDVQIYSACIGATLAAHTIGLPDYQDGRRFRLDIKPDQMETWGWVQPWLEDPLDACATLMLGSRMMVGAASKAPTAAYYEKVRGEYRRQWPEMHAKTREKLATVNMPLETFYVGDVLNMVQDAPTDSAVVVFPPFFAGDYEAQFRHLDAVFDWDTPTYPMLNDERINMLFESAASKQHWLIGNNHRRPSWERYLIGRVQTSNRGVPIYVYGTGQKTRVVAPRQKLQPVLTQRLQAGEAIGDRLSVAVMNHDQFVALRSAYMNHNIKPGTLPLAVLVDGKLVGVCAYSTAPTFSKWDAFLPAPTAYMLSDFPVAGTDYPRLAKLIVMAALSAEVKGLIERYAGKRYRSMNTTAFTKRPVSMKYRGALKLLKRQEVKLPPGTDTSTMSPADLYTAQGYELSYGAVLGEQTLAEILAEWKTKHGERKAIEPA